MLGINLLLFCIKSSANRNGIPLPSIEQNSGSKTNKNIGSIVSIEGGFLLCVVRKWSETRNVNDRLSK